MERALDTDGHPLPAVKALHGQWRDSLRLRVGDQRAVFSWHEGAVSGERVAYVHDVGLRRDIYQRGSVERLKEWISRRPDHWAEGYWEAPASGASCCDQEVQPLPLLSDKQWEFSASVLGSGRVPSEVFVWLGVGPPGSGKTIVASELVRDGLEDRYDTIFVLVPSEGLKSRFQKFLGATGEGCPRPGRRLDVVRVVDFFAEQSQIPLQRGDATVEKWWDRALRLPFLKGWSQRHSRLDQRRFSELIDGMLFDKGADGGRNKDALANNDRQLLEALRDLERASFRRAVEDSRREHDVTLRWERARKAQAALAVLEPGSRLLLVVDEAQELVPAEWQTLLCSAWGRRQKGWHTDLVLLGDENQRVAPTATSWTDIREYLASVVPNATPQTNLRDFELPGSYRIPRPVAAVANPLVDGRMNEDKSRYSAYSRLEDLIDDGEVVVIESSDIERDLCEAARRVAVPGGSNVRVIVLSDRLRGGGLLETVFSAEAKGLEWDAVVVAGLFDGDTVDFAARTCAYMRLTRARHLLVVLVSPDERARMEGFWSGLSRVFFKTVRELPRYVERSIVRSSAVERRDELSARVENLLSEQKPRFDQILDRVVEMLRLEEKGREQGIQALFDKHLDLHPDWEDRIRAAGHKRGGEHYLAALVALGDPAEALFLSGKSPSLKAYTARLQRVVATAGPLVGACYDLWRKSRDGDRLEDLVHRAMKHELGVALTRREVQRPSGRPPASDPQYRRLERRVQRAMSESIESLKQEWGREVDMLREKMTNNVDNQRREIERGAPCVKLREVERRLREVERDIAAQEVAT